MSIPTPLVRIVFETSSAAGPNSSPNWLSRGDSNARPPASDAGALVRKIAAYKPTIIAATPTFLGFILDRAQPGDLDSLRIVIVGAEKCPEHVFEKARAIAPRAEVLEAPPSFDNPMLSEIYNGDDFKAGVRAFLAKERPAFGR